MIEGHSHLFLHPYDETSWNDQVNNESLAFRTARATAHAKQTLLAGFTTVRDLGTEGAGYGDVGLKKSDRTGNSTRTRMIVVTRAIVANGSYGPKLSTDLHRHRARRRRAAWMNRPRSRGSRSARRRLGEALCRLSLGAGVSLRSQRFSQDEMTAAVRAAHDAGRPVRPTPRPRKECAARFWQAFDTIEHGDEGTPEVFKLMKEHGVAFCPTVAAGDAIEQYRGWKKGVTPEPAHIREKRTSIESGARRRSRLRDGGDVGVFAHGENAREWSCSCANTASHRWKSCVRPRAATPRFFISLIAAASALVSWPISLPSKAIRRRMLVVVRQVRFVMKGGVIYLQP